jgi:hypothetical protein
MYLKGLSNGLVAVSVQIDFIFVKLSKKEGFYNLGF